MSELHTAAEKLIKIYKEDLEENLGNELVQFVALIDAFKTNYIVNREPKEMFFYGILANNSVGAAFPNVKLYIFGDDGVELLWRTPIF
jgi:hypothetical protein